MTHSTLEAGPDHARRIGAVVAIAVVAAFIALLGPATSARADADTQSVPITCDSATLFDNFSPANGPLGPRVTMVPGESVGYRYSWDDSWDVVLHYRTGQWGFMLRSCHGAASLTGRIDFATSPGATSRTVCATDVYVRDPDMRVVGRLYYGQTMAIERYADSGIGTLGVGFAYGDANKHGYVQASAFC